MDSLDFCDYPMGPALRRFLGIDAAAYRGEGASQPSAERDQLFMCHLEGLVTETPVLERAALIDLLEELTAMGMSRLAILLREANPAPSLGEDFRAVLALGSAAMMEGELEEAEHLLLKAHLLEPEEAAPYLNLAEIYYATERDESALQWALAGLKLTPNRGRLWELVGSIHMVADGANASAKVRELALSLDSYSGLSLAAEMIDARDPLLKAQLLESLYEQGVRDDAFLVEYTAALGLARQYEKVPVIVWELEKIAGKAVPWQLYAHAAQAHLALGEEMRAAEILTRLERRGDCPSEVVADLRNTYEDAASAASDLRH